MCVCACMQFVNIRAYPQVYSYSGQKITAMQTPNSKNALNKAALPHPLPVVYYHLRHRNMYTYLLTIVVLRNVRLIILVADLINCMHAQRYLHAKIKKYEEVWTTFCGFTY